MMEGSSLSSFKTNVLRLNNLICSFVFSPENIDRNMFSLILLISLSKKNNIHHDRKPTMPTSKKRRSSRKRSSSARRYKRSYRSTYRSADDELYRASVAATALNTAMNPLILSMDTSVHQAATDVLAEMARIVDLMEDTRTNSGTQLVQLLSGFVTELEKIK